MFVRILMWPVIAIVITGMVHLGLEAAWPDLQTFFVPSVLAPLLLAYGAWVGYRGIGAGAGFATAAVAGIVLGVLPLGLDIVGFGMILGRGVDQGLLAGLFGMAFVTFGALLGAGFAVSAAASTN